MTDFIQNGVLEDTMRRKVSKDVVIDRMVFVRHTNVISVTKLRDPSQILKGIKMEFI